MSVAEAAAAFGAPLRPLAPIGDESSCHYVFPGGNPGAISFMLVDERVARIDVTAPGPLTVDGVGVGSPESEVKRVYRDRVEVSPHKYTGPEGHYLTIAQGEFAIVFETDGTRVTGYRAGRLPEVAWVERCS